MRFLLLSAAFLPTVTFAESVCYSPSDCAAPEVCSYLLDGAFPGICREPKEGEALLYELQDAVPAESSSSSVSSAGNSSSSSAPAPVIKPPLAEVSVLVPSSASVSSSESSVSSIAEEALQKKPSGNFITKAFGGFFSDIKNAFCFFFCSEE